MTRQWCVCLLRLWFLFLPFTRTYSILYKYACFYSVYCTFVGIEEYEAQNNKTKMYTVHCCIKLITKRELSVCLCQTGVYVRPCSSTTCCSSLIMSVSQTQRRQSLQHYTVKRLEKEGESIHCLQGNPPQGNTRDFTKPIKGTKEAYVNSMYVCYWDYSVIVCWRALEGMGIHYKRSWSIMMDNLHSKTPI